MQSGNCIACCSVSFRAALTFLEILFAFATAAAETEFHKRRNLSSARVHHPNPKIAVASFAAADERDFVIAFVVGFGGIFADG